MITFDKNERELLNTLSSRQDKIYAKSRASYQSMSEMRQAINAKDWDWVRNLILSGVKDDFEDYDYKEYPLIFDLIWAGQERLTLSWLERGYPPHVRGGRERLTLLHAAAAHDRTHLLSALLAMKGGLFSVNKPDHNGHTSLYHAAKWGSADCAKILLSHNANVNGLESDDDFEEDMHLETPLAVAANAEMAEILLKAGANLKICSYSDVKYSDPFGMGDEFLTPLTTAAMSGRMDVVKLLMRYGMPLDHQPLRFMTFEEGIKAGHIREIVSLGADPNGEPGKEPLLIAAWQGNAEQCQALLDAGAKPMENAVALAIKSGKKGCIEVFLKNRIDDLPQAVRLLAKTGQEDLLFPLLSPRLSGHALHGAIAGCRFLLARKILTMFPECLNFKDREGKTPLMTLFSMDLRIDTFRFITNDPKKFIKKGVRGFWSPTEDDYENGNRRDFDYNRPHNWNELLNLAEDEVMTLAKELASLGTDLRARDNMGRSTLWHACAMPFLKAIPLLAGLGLDINQRDLGGTSCFDAGCLSGESLAIRPMLESGAVIDAQDHNGDTALLKCARQALTSEQALGAVYDLVEAGANPDQENQNGETARKLAKTNDRLASFIEWAEQDRR